MEATNVPLLQPGYITLWNMSLVDGNTTQYSFVNGASFTLDQYVWSQTEWHTDTESCEVLLFGQGMDDTAYMKLMLTCGHQPFHLSDIGVQLSNSNGAQGVSKKEWTWSLTLASSELCSARSTFAPGCPRGICPQTVSSHFVAGLAIATVIAVLAAAYFLISRRRRAHVPLRDMRDENEQVADSREENAARETERESAVQNGNSGYQPNNVSGASGDGDAECHNDAVV